MDQSRALASPEFLAAFDAIPMGTHRAVFQGGQWLVTKTRLAQGRAEKLLARELGGTGYVSLNLYRLPQRALLKPCEMPRATAIAFVLGLRVEAEQASTASRDM